MPLCKWLVLPILSRLGLRIRNSKPIKKLKGITPSLIPPLHPKNLSHFFTNSKMYKRKQVKENTHLVAKHMIDMCPKIIAPPRNLIHGRYFYSQNKILD